MPGDILTLPQPAPGESTQVRVPEGQDAAFGFSSTQIQDVHLTASGAIEIRVEGGGLIVIENFRDLAARGAKIPMADGMSLDASLVYNTLAADPEPESHIAVFIPKPGDSGEHEYILKAGQKYILGFDAQAPEFVRELDGALVFSFAGGSTVVLRNFVAVESGELPPEMTLADGLIVPFGNLSDVFGSARTTFAEASVGLEAAAARLASIAPAAGATAASAPPATSAPGQGPANSGYGLRSSPDSVGLTPVDPVGPINPTALQYNAPLFQPDVYGLPQPKTPAPLPRLTPVLEVSDALVHEDGSTILDLSATRSEPGTTLTVSIDGIPAGWSVAGPGAYDPGTGMWTITVPPGTPFPGGPTLSPPHNSDADLTGLVVTVTETDAGTGRSTTTTDTLDVITDAVADVPDVNAQSATGPEDIALPLVIDAAVTDTDGSESLATIYVRGVPDGFTLSAGTNNGGGEWQLTPAQLPGLTVTPPANYSGAFPLIVEVISQETVFSGIEPDLTNNQASNTQTITMKWCPVADAPDLLVHDAQVKEDGSVFVPVKASLVDRDGSEHLTITISGLPAGWTLTGAGWTPTATPGQFKIFLAPGVDYTGGFTLAPPANSDADIPALQIKATSTETDGGDTASTVQTIQIITDAVADAPTVHGEDATGNRGTALNVVIGGAVTDTDGSESITGYKISGVPSGFVFNHGSNLGGGVWSFTPAQIAGLTITPPASYVGKLDLNVTAFSGETHLSGVEFDLSDNAAQASDPFCLTWKPVANPPTISVNNGVESIVVKEDGSIFVPIKAALGAGGSGDEILTVTVTGISPTWTITNANGTYTPATGTWTITLPPGTNYNGGLTFAPPANSDADLSGLKATASAFEPETNTTATTNDPFAITTDAVADAPTLSAGAASGEEGSAIPLSIAAAVTDTDGSESITLIRIGNVPTGASLNHGTQVSPGVWELAPSDLAGLKITVPNNAAGNYTLSVTAISRETTLSGGEVDLTDNQAQKTVSLRLSVTPDDVPILVQPELVSVDETNLGPITVNDAASANFGSDGPGSFRATGAASFSASGSLASGVLTSGGVAIAVALLGNTYVGKAGAETIFTLSIQPDGQYQFKLLGTLDHADGSNPNDVIALKFGITATDSDDDSSNGFITVNVADDALLAHNDVNEFQTSAGGATGNVITGLNGGAGATDDLSNDQPNHVTKITFGSTTLDVPATGTTSIDGAHGKLTIAANGSYTYDLFDNAYDHIFNGLEAFPSLAESRALGASDQDTLGIANGDLDLSGAVTGKVTFVSEGAGYSNTLGVYTVAPDGTIQNVDFVIANGNSVAAGASLTFSVQSTADQSLGFFLIANGFSLNGGYAGLDLNAGDLAFVYKRGTADERPAKITDDGGNVSLVFIQDGTGTETLLSGPIYHTTERGDSTSINADGSIRVVSGLPDIDDPTVLRIGFEDLPNLGDKDYNDMVFDLSLRPAGCAEDVFRYTLADGDGDASSALLTLKCEAPPLTVAVQVNNGADDVIVKEDGSVFVPVHAATDHGDGNETLSLTLNGVGPGWTLTGAGWTPTGTPGQFKITLPPGADYAGGFTLKPPANSDADLSGLSVTALASDPDGGTATGSDTFRVITDAVADAPTVHGEDATGNRGTALNVVIGGAVTDTDGSESITGYKISGVPSGFVFNHGLNLGGGVWSFTPAQIAGLTITPPASYVGKLDLNVTAFSGETHLSGVEFDLSDNAAQASDPFCLTWKPVANAAHNLCQ
ncbi:MAG: DUF4114 domain-containing protein [Rhodospirillales bacterium]|nr:DUF4114 domain-containing protein [Rhodospirillales bacterium]